MDPFNLQLMQAQQCRIAEQVRECRNEGDGTQRTIHWRYVRALVLIGVVLFLTTTQF